MLWRAPLSEELRSHTSPYHTPSQLTLSLLPTVLLQLLLGLQTSISGELRSCLLDSLSQSTSTPGSASISMSEEEIAAQLATAIAEARKERAAAASEGLEEAIAAGNLAAWVFKAAVGVGALQLVKAGAGMAMERVSVCVCWCSCLQCFGANTATCVAALAPPDGQVQSIAGLRVTVSYSRAATHTNLDHHCRIRHC
jgi:hypothetical protein